MDGARPVQPVADHPRCRQAERLTRVCDHLNIPPYASFYEPFRPPRRMAQCVRLAFPPRHGSWLNRAEPELSVLTRQALSPAQGTAWAEARNAVQTDIDWPFRTADASNIYILQKPTWKSKLQNFKSNKNRRPCRLNCA